MERPILGMTMGDICGIGPEITAKALGHREVYEKCRPLVVGSTNAFCRGLAVTGGALKVNSIARVEDALFRFGTVDVLDLGDIPLEEAPFGKVTMAGGEGAFKAVETVIHLAMEGKIDATVTGPLNKEAMNLAGHHYSGHTEIYAELTGTKEYSMMLAEGDLRVVHVSTHVSLQEACNRVTKKRVLSVIEIADQACKALGIEAPRIAVAGLNPHAGENGLFGREELEEIAPAIEKAREQGIDADGPIPADTVFSKARGGLYDIVVAMYHDQGHIPLKVLGFVYDRQTEKWSSVSGVNITLGLPIIRTSVDHGTAFDQAGKNTATEESLIGALTYATKLALAKRGGCDG